ncbi:Two-component sensor histidine kinase [Methylocella tundrae]|uniref:histidine kinase n=1 Tax=Methylocella tundrae TaxID=227605 RepID=A0A8B6MA99_METTU|nr:HAMP domain-containing sensor histidine kinase [Methylocella tundrae]VTZ51947.1 Two-component sensor histidine kinase [Methylocella tundrae]
MWIFDLFKTATFRLAVLFALAVTASTSVVFVFIYWQVATFDVRRVEARLSEEVLRAVNEPEDQLRRQLERRLASDLRRLDYVGLFNKDGKPVYGNIAALPGSLAIDGLAHTVEVLPLKRIDSGTEPAMMVARRRPSGGVVLLGRSLYEVYALRQLVFAALTIGIAPAVALALIVGLIFSLRGARRLKTINQTIVRIMRGDLHERLPIRARPDDIDHIASAVNLMLDEMVRLLDQIKSVGDNIAHDLRTPLAVMRISLERGLAAPSEQGLRSAAQRALTELDHALTTVTALQRISEIELGRRRGEFTRIDLAEVCANAFNLYEPLAEAKSITFTLDAPAPAPCLGDFELMTEAVANLIDNAIKFTPEKGAVQVVAKMNSGRPVIRVSDTGPGVTPEERGEIFKRFYRSESSRHIPGTGLGLNMAATICNLHGFDLRVDDNQPGAIFEVTPHNPDSEESDSVTSPVLATASPH